MDYNPSTFQYIKQHPNHYNILYNNILYTIKPSEHGLGLFAAQDIPRSTRLGYACNLSSNMYSYYLQTKCNTILKTMTGRNISKRFNTYYTINKEEIHESIVAKAVQDHKNIWGANYYFSTDMFSPVGILESPNIKYTYLLLNMQETPFGFSNSSIDKPSRENIKVDYDTAVYTTKDISKDTEIRWTYDF